MKKNMATQNNTNVVFIDTNLDTHLALVVSNLDTVSDLKKRIVSEHLLCFPKIGQIQIHGIKVKRKGHFYHLSDSMLVSSVFSGFSKSWFLSVDTSVLVGEEIGPNEQLFSCGTPNQLVCLGIANNVTCFLSERERACRRNNLQLLQLEDKLDENGETRVVSPRVSERMGEEAVKNWETGVKSSGNNDVVIPLPGSGFVVNHGTPSLHAEGEVDGSSKGIKNDCSVHAELMPCSKKKRMEDTVQDDVASVDNPLSIQTNMASGFNSLQVPRPENKQDENGDISFDGPHISDHTENVIKKREMDVNSSVINDPSFPLPVSVPETQDYSDVNHEPSNSHIACEERTTKSAPSAKKKKSKRKRQDTLQDDTPKGIGTSVVGPGDHTVQQNIVVQANPSENVDKEVVNESEVLNEHQHTVSNKNKMIVGPGDHTDRQDIVVQANLSENIDKEVITKTEALSMKEASEPASAAKKKRKKRKSCLTHDSEDVLKVDTASQKVDAQKFDEAHKERKESEDQFVLNGKSRDAIEYEQNKVTGDILDSTPPAKEKKKGKKKSGDKSLSEAKLNNDLMADDASDQFLENQLNIKNSLTDQSAENFDDADPLKTGVSRGTMKGKVNASSPHETPVVTSLKKDEEADRSSIQREGVHDGKSEYDDFAKGISTSKTTLDNMEIGTDATNQGIQSTVKRSRKHKRRHDIQMEVPPSDVNEPMELNRHDENAVLVHCHKSEACQTEEAEEGREPPPQNDPKLMLLEKRSLSNQDNTDASIRETNVTPKDVDTSDITEPVKSEKRKRGTSKAKKLGGGPSHSEGIGLVDASESETVSMKSLKATHCDQMSRNSRAEENPLNQTEEHEMWQEEMQGTFATDKEDNSGADNVGSLEQIETKSNAERVDKRKRGKSHNKQTSPSKSISDMQTKDQVLDSKKPSLSSDIGTHASPTMSKTKKSRSASTKSATKSSKSNLEPVKDSDRLESSDHRLNSGGNETSQFLSNTLEGHKLGKFEANDAAQDSTRLSREKDDDANQQFESQKQQHEAKLSGNMLVDEMNGADRTDLDTITGRNTHQLEASKERTHAEPLSFSALFSSKIDSDVLKTQPDKKVTKERKTGQDAKLSSRSDSAMSSIGENRKRQVSASGKSMNLEKQREHIPIPKTKLEGSRKSVPNKAGKATGKNIGELGVTRSKRRAC